MSEGMFSQVMTQMIMLHYTVQPPTVGKLRNLAVVERLNTW